MNAKDFDLKTLNLMTINEVAKVLRVSRAMVYTLIEQGELNPIIVGERKRFDERDVKAYLEKRMSPRKE